MFFGGDIGRVTIQEPISQATIDKKLSRIFLKQIGLEDETDPSSDYVYSGFMKLKDDIFVIGMNPFKADGDTMQFIVSREYSGNKCETHLTTILGEGNTTERLNILQTIADTLGGSYDFKEMSFSDDGAHYSGKSEPVQYDTQNEIHLLALESSEKVKQATQKTLAQSGVTDPVFSETIADEIYRKTKSSILESVNNKNLKSDFKNS